MKFRSKRELLRGKRKEKVHKVVLRLSSSDFEILKRQSSEARFPSLSEYALFMFRMLLHDVEDTAVAQEKEFGVRFVDPDDCSCCGGVSFEDLN